MPVLDIGIVFMGQRITITVTSGWAQAAPGE